MAVDILADGLLHALSQENGELLSDILSKIRLQTTSTHWDVPGSGWKSPNTDSLLRSTDLLGNMIDLGGYASLLYWNLLSLNSPGIDELAEQALALRQLIRDPNVVLAAKGWDDRYLGMTVFYPHKHIKDHELSQEAFERQYKEDISGYIPDNEYRADHYQFLQDNNWLEFIKKDLRTTMVEFEIINIDPEPIIAGEQLHITFKTNRELTEEPIAMFSRKKWRHEAEERFTLEQGSEAFTWEGTAVIPEHWAGDEIEVTFLYAGKERTLVGTNTFPVEASPNGREFRVTHITPNVEAGGTITITFTTNEPIPIEKGPRIIYDLSGNDGPIP